MGKRWRRMSERLRQNVVAPHFQPASTERNHMMFREASSYHKHFKTVIKKLTRLVRDYGDMSESVQMLLGCRVPRLFTMESDGSVGAEMPDGDAYLGAGIQTEQLTSSSQTLKSRVSEEVVVTLQQWFKSYERCKMMLNEVNELKFELDSRHRTVLSLDTKRGSFEGQVKNGDSTKEVQLTSTIEKLKHKERKMDVCQTEFQQKEEELNQALRGLLSEVRCHAELIGHIYHVISDATSEAHRAFKTSTSSVAHSPIHVQQRVERNEAFKKGPALEFDHSNPFLTPPSST